MSNRRRRAPMRVSEWVSQEVEPVLFVRSLVLWFPGFISMIWMFRLCSQSIGLVGSGLLVNWNKSNNTKLRVSNQRTLPAEWYCPFEYNFGPEWETLFENKTVFSYCLARSPEVEGYSWMDGYLSCSEHAACDIQVGWPFGKLESGCCRFDWFPSQTRLINQNQSNFEKQEAEQEKGKQVNKSGSLPTCIRRTNKLKKRDWNHWKLDSFSCKFILRCSHDEDGNDDDDDDEAEEEQENEANWKWNKTVTLIQCERSYPVRAIRPMEPLIGFLGDFDFFSFRKGLNRNLFH